MPLPPYPGAPPTKPSCKYPLLTQHYISTVGVKPRSALLRLLTNISVI